MAVNRSFLVQTSIVIVSPSNIYMNINHLTSMMLAYNYSNRYI